MNDDGTLILPFGLHHLHMMKLQAHEKEILDFEVFSRVAEGNAHTYIYRGNVMCIYGYFYMWEGVIDIFIIPSMYFLLYPKWVLKWAKIEFAKVKTLPLHRIQSASLDDPVRSRFMRHFGFQSEGVLRRYTSRQQDYRMWSMTRAQGEAWDS